MEMIKAMNKDLGFDEIYGTELIVENNTYTGKVKINLAEKEGKTKIIKEYFKNNSQKNSIGFGDTQSDIAFLDEVTHPIAINPNNILKKYAEEQKNYTIIDKNIDIIKEIEKILNK